MREGEREKEREEKRGREVGRGWRSTGEAEGGGREGFCLEVLSHPCSRNRGRVGALFRFKTRALAPFIFFFGFFQNRSLGSCRRLHLKN